MCFSGNGALANSGNFISQVTPIGALTTQNDSGTGPNTIGNIQSSIGQVIGDINGSNAATANAQTALNNANANQQQLISNDLQTKQDNEVVASNTAGQLRDTAAKNAVNPLGFNSPAPSQLLATVAAANPSKDFMGL